jgi:hypothetical protein
MRYSTLAILVLSACGDSSHAPIDAPPPPPDAAVDGHDASETCDVVPDIGSTIMEMFVATAIPVPQGGGPIADGTYKLTALTKYTGPGGMTGPTGAAGSETSYLAAGLSHLVTTVDGSPNYEVYTVMTSGTAVVITRTCPTRSPTGFDGYSQIDGVVTFYDSQNAASREFTKIP